MGRCWSRLAAWFCLVCLSAVVHGQASKLDPFVGKDLWKLSDAERSQLHAALGWVRDPAALFTQPVPWRLWRTTRTGPARYILLLGKPLMKIPGGSAATVRLLDATSNEIKSWSFQTGWRIDLRDAYIEASSGFAADLIVLRTAAAINGRNVSKEFFALSNSRLRLVRLEDDQGALVQNEYVFPNYEIGMVPEAQSVDQWAGLLESTDEADVLSALVYLGGKHVDEPERWSLPGPHQSKYAGVSQEVNADPRIRDIIKRLARSENRWIQPAAELAESTFLSQHRPLQAAWRPSSRQPAVICGRVRRPDGSGVGRARVVLWPEPKTVPQAAAVTLTGADGSFRMADLRPARYKLSGVATEPGEVWAGFFGGRRSADAATIFLNGGEEACSHDLVVYRQPIYRVGGRAVAHEGTVWPPSRISLALVMDRGDAFPFEQRVAPGPDGQFEFRGIPPGRYQFSVSSTGLGSGSGNQQELDVSGDLEGLRVVLPIYRGGITVSETINGNRQSRQLSEIESNEHAAQFALQRLSMAQSVYRSKYGSGFSANLNVLGPSPAWYGPTAENAGLVDDLLAGRFPGDSGSQLTANGYSFGYTPGPKDGQGQITGYTLGARPIQHGVTGSRSFFTDQTGIIRATTVDRPATVEDPPTQR